MAEKLNFYESVFVVDLENGEEAIKATIDKFTSLIAANGEILEIKDKAPTWGKRRLAYEINDKREGYYVVVTFKANADFPNELYRLFNIDETIMRSMVLKLEYDAAVKKAAKIAAEEAAAAQAAAAEAEVVAEAPAADAE